MSAPTGAGRRHPQRATPALLRLHVQLDGAFPPVWRRIEVASDLALDDLHAVLQVVFGWEDYHLHRFTTGPEHAPGAAFACTADLAQGFDDDPAVPTWDVRVDELLAESGERLFYQYDYGDNWWLAIEVEDVDDGHVTPGRATLLEGAGAGPPEDCGGIHGYRMIVAAAGQARSPPMASHSHGRHSPHPTGDESASVVERVDASPADPPSPPPSTRMVNRRQASHRPIADTTLAEGAGRTGGLGFRRGLFLACRHATEPWLRLSNVAVRQPGPDGMLGEPEKHRCASCGRTNGATVSAVSSGPISVIKTRMAAS